MSTEAGKALSSVGLELSVHRDREGTGFCWAGAAGSSEVLDLEHISGPLQEQQVT